jgi:hypothetical protein
MKFIPLAKRKPKGEQVCVIKVVNCADYVIYEIRTFDSHRGFWPYTQFEMPAAEISWAPLPSHAGIDRRYWRSEYWGDELPNESCWCLVCTDTSRKVMMAYFDKKAQSFLGRDDVVAFIPLMGR